MNRSCPVAFTTEIDGARLRINVTDDVIRQWGLHPDDAVGIRITGHAIAAHVLQGESLAGHARWDVAITASRQVLVQPSASLN
jgi:hypothetical protein